MAKNLDFNVEFKTQQAADDFKRLFEAYINGSKRAGDLANSALGGTVEKTVQVRLETDQAGARKLTTLTRDARTELDKYERAFKTATAVDRNSITSLRQQYNAAKQARDAIAKFGTEIDKSNRSQVFSSKISDQWLVAAANVRRLESELKNLELAGSSSFDRLAASFDFSSLIQFGDGISRIVNIFQSLNIIAAQIVAPIKAVTGALAELQSFGLAFEAIGQDSSGAQKALGDARTIALGLGVSIQTVRDGFKQLTPVVVNSGGNIGDVSNIVESLSSRFAAFGLNADRSRRVLNGVIQAFAKGKLQAEELTQQISEADPAFKTDFAAALFSSRDALGALGKEVDGTVTQLEQLVKAGSITSDVLIKVLPKLSKASFLFGKLGPTATSAVDALAQGSVIISQVEANLASLNQLNLEKLAKLAEPLVVTFLRGQAIVTDFVTRLTELQATKDIISIFNSFGDAIIRTLNVVTSLAEGLLRVIGVFAPFISALAKIPGLIELIGLSIIGRFLNPLNRLEGGLIKNLVIQNRFIQGLKQAWQNAGTPVQDFTAKVDDLRSNLAKPISLRADTVDSGLLTKTTDLRIQQERETGDKIVSINRKTQRSILEDWRKNEADIAKLLSKKAKVEGVPALKEELNSQIALLKELKQERKGIMVPDRVNANPDLPRLIDPNDIDLTEELNDRLDDLIYTYNEYTRTLPKTGAETTFMDFTKAVASSREELERLAKTNPAEALLIVEQAQRAINMQRNMAEKMQSAGRIEVSIKNEAAINDIADTVKTIVDTTKKSRPWEIFIEEDIARAKELDTQIENIDQQIKKLRAGIKEGTSSTYSTKDEQRLLKLEARRKRIEQERRSSSKSDSMGETTDLEKRIKALDSVSGSEKELMAATTDRLLAEKKGSSAKLALIDQEVAGLKRLLVEQRKIAASTRTPEAFAGVRDTENQIRDLTGSREAVIGALRAQSRAEADLAAAQMKASGVNATYGDKLNYTLTALRNATTLSLQYAETIAATEGRLTAIKKRQDDLNSSPIRSREQIRELGSLRAEADILTRGLVDLRDQQLAASNNVNSLNSTLRSQVKELNRTKNNTTIVGKSLDVLSRSLTVAGNAANGLKGAFVRGFSGAALGFKSLLSAIGPLELLIIAASIATRAYADANAVSAKVASDSANRVQVLDAALKELRGTVEQNKEPASGFALAWLRFSYVIKDVADALGKILVPAFNSASTGIVGFIGNIGKLAVAALAGAASGAALGATIGALGGPIGAGGGAVIGAIAASIVALASSGSSADVELRQTKDAINALGAAAKVESTKITQLFSELEKLKAERDKAAATGKSTTLIDANISKNFIIARDAYNGLQKEADGLRIKQKQINDEIGKMNPELVSNIKLQNELNALKAKEGVLRPQAINPSGTKATETKEQKAAQVELEKTQQKIKEVEAALKKSNVDTNSEEYKKAAERYAYLNQSAYALRLGIKTLTGTIEQNKVAMQNWAMATGRVLDPQKQAIASTGQLEDAIKKLEEGASSYDLTVRNKKGAGRDAYDNDIDKVRQLKGALETLSKTKYEINIENKKLQSALNQAQIDIAIAPGAIRDATKLGEQINSDLSIASLEFLDKVKGAKALFEENKGLTKDAANIIKQAATEFLGKTRDSAAKLIDVGRQLKENFEQAKASLTSLKLDKPGFFTKEEIRANAQQIETDYIAALDKVRQETGDYNFVPVLEGSTRDEILKSKNDFIQTRKEADNLAKTMKEAAGAMTIAAIALAKIAGIELSTLGADLTKVFGKDLKEVAPGFQEFIKNVLDTDKQLNNLGSSGNAQKRIGDIVGTIEAGGKKMVLYSDLMTGKVEEVTAAQFEQLKAADKATASNAGYANQFNDVSGAVTKAASDIGGSATAYGQATNAAAPLVSFMKDGVAYISNVGTEAKKTGSNLTGAFSSALGPLSQYVDSLGGITDNTNESKKSLDKLFASGKNFAIGNTRGVLLPPAQIDEIKVSEDKVRAAAKQVGGDFDRTLQQLAAQGDTGNLPFGMVSGAGVLNNVAAAAKDYTYALQTTNMAAAQVTRAQEIYNQALAEGRPDAIQYAAALKDAQDTYQASISGLGGLATAAQGWNEAKQAAQGYGITLNSIPGVGNDRLPGYANMADELKPPPTAEQKWEDYKNRVQSAIDVLRGVKSEKLPSVEPVKAPEVKSNELLVDMQGSADATNALNTELSGTNTELTSAASTIAKIKSDLENMPTSIKVTVTQIGIPGRWSGGPVSAGSLYRVNELGREGFLSRGGNLSAINKPKNALWRPPAAGTVIPAHIMSQLDKTNKGIAGNRPTMSGYNSNNRGINQVTSILGGYLKAQSGIILRNENDNRRMQSHQAMQISKLAEAVNSLVEKNWNVDVKVRNTGNATYLDALNRAL